MSIIDQLKKSIDSVGSTIAVPAPRLIKLKLGDLAFFLQFIRPIWLTGITSMILVLFTTAISSLLPLSSKIFIDFVILKTGYTGIESVLASLNLSKYSPAVTELAGSIEAVIVAMIAAALVYGALDLLEKYLTAVYQQQITSRVQTALFDHVLRFPISIIRNKQTGYLMSRIYNDIYTLQYTFSDGILEVVGSVFYILFSLAIILSLNSGLAMIIGISIPVYLVLRYVFSDRIRGLSYREQELTAEVSSIMQEAISGAEVVKSYATEKREVARVSARLDHIAKARISKYLHIVFAHSSMKGTTFLLLLFIMMAGARSIQGDKMTIGDYVTFITYIVFLSHAMNNLFYSYMNFQPAFASIGRLKEIFNIVPEWDDNSGALKKIDRVRGDISFENVSFAYDQDQPILHSISFHVKPGEKVALVGYSGAGKSTLVNLLLKLYVPQSGHICLDGVDISEIDHQWLRQQISVVSQDIFLFNDTIENNIKYGKTTASRGDVIGVARKAHIHDFIISLPDGYDTLIGERGAKLSVGQRQRISIARAFLKDTPLLILDEPTSAIDPETEAYLKDSLERLMRGKTTFIISHRMSLTEIADKIIVIDRGMIAEYGTPMDLKKNNGFYNIMRTYGNADTNHLLKLK